VTVTDLLTPPEQANLIAAQAVAAATSFIDGRSDKCTLAASAGRIFEDIGKVAPDLRARQIVDATKLLAMTMINTAVSNSARGDRWADVMKAFVELLRHESTDLVATGAQRQ
jgi:hypothetical protein